MSMQAPSNYAKEYRDLIDAEASEEKILSAWMRERASFRKAYPNPFQVGDKIITWDGSHGTVTEIRTDPNLKPVIIRYHDSFGKGAYHLEQLIANPHDCYEHAVAYESDGALGHGWDCGLCGDFLQAG